MSREFQTLLPSDLSELPLSLSVEKAFSNNTTNAGSLRRSCSAIPRANFSATIKRIRLPAPACAGFNACFKGFSPEIDVFGASKVRIKT